MEEKNEEINNLLRDQGETGEKQKFLDNLKERGRSGGSVISENNGPPTRKELEGMGGQVSSAKAGSPSAGGKIGGGSESPGTSKSDTNGGPSGGQKNTRPIPTKKGVAEDSGEDNSATKGSEGGGLTSPEAVLMLPVAAALDILGFFVFILGTWFAIDDYGILDIIGGIIIGGWMLIRYSSFGSKGSGSESPNAGSEKIKEGVEKAGGKLKEGAMESSVEQAGKQLGKQGLKRFGIASITELIPFIGGLAPAWTIMVWKELKS